MSTAPLDSALGGSPTETPMDVLIAKAEREAESDGYLALDDVRWLIKELRASRAQVASLLAAAELRRIWTPAVASSSQETPNG